MPANKINVISERRKQVYELTRQGLSVKEVATKLGRWHWRTIEDDVRALKSSVIDNAPSWFTDAQITAFESIDDLKTLRDKAWEMLGDSYEPKLHLMARIQVMRLLADINGRLADKLLPSQAIVENIGSKDITIRWVGDPKDTPLCTRCGQKHIGECKVGNTVNSIQPT